MEWFTTTDYVEIYNVSGYLKDKKIVVEEMPEVILSDRQMELQEVCFYDGGYGHRNTYSNRMTISFDFIVNKYLPSITGKLHKHDYFDIMIVDKGSIELQIESKFCELNEGDVCILNRSTRHAERFKPGHKVFYIALAPGYISSWPRDEGVGLPSAVAKFFDKGMKEPLSQNKDYLFASLSKQGTKSELLDIVEELKAEFQGKKPGYQFFIKGLLYRFFCTLVNPKKYTMSYVDIGTNDGFSLAFLAKQIIDKCKHRITKTEISQRLNYNGEYINQVFKNHYGCTIPEYTKLVCLRQGANMLVKTSLPVQNICRQLGFMNRTHFYKLFKQEYGCTPDEYRKNIAMIKD